MTSWPSSNSEPSFDAEALFYAVLSGVIANGSQETWGGIYEQAKAGAQAIAALMIEDVVDDELSELTKDMHGR